MKIQEKNLGAEGGGVGPGDSIRVWVGEGSSKVWGRWVMWGKEDVNQE